MTRKINELIQQSLAIEAQEAKDAGQLGFMVRALVQATLPHSQCHEQEFERTNGAHTESFIEGVLPSDREHGSALRGPGGVGVAAGAAPQPRPRAIRRLAVGKKAQPGIYQVGSVSPDFASRAQGVGRSVTPRHGSRVEPTGSSVDSPHEPGRRRRSIRAADCRGTEPAPRGRSG